MTASHCVFNNDGSARSYQIIAVINALDIDTAYPEQTFSVGSIARPKAYNPQTNGNHYADIALLLLRKPSYSRSLKLTTSRSFNGDQSYLVVGWGWTQGRDGVGGLSYSPVPGVNSTEFKSWSDAYSSANGLPKAAVALEGDHCAAGLGRGAAVCVGDSGGPLIAGGPSYDGSKLDRDTQIGIVSYGVSQDACGGAGSIGFFTKVGFWATWIQDTISLNNWRGFSTPYRTTSVLYDTCLGGKDLKKPAPVKSAGACADVCRKYTNCAAWSWKPETLACRQKKSVVIPANKGSCVSGLMTTSQ